MGSVMDGERPWERVEREKLEQAKRDAPRYRRDDICNRGAAELLMEAMLGKLARSRAKQAGRPFWHEAGCSNEDLSRALREHVEKGDPVDVANFCLMLFARDERIAAGGDRSGA